MSTTQALLKFFAARLNVPGDALEQFFISARLGRPAETALPFPAELIPLGARLVLRGWRNNKFFPTNRDWVLPYWAERQFDPSDPAFLPRGMNLYTINYTHRDWTMIGNLHSPHEAVIDLRGLVTPWFDGWSLDVWLATEEKFFAPSRLAAGAIAQALAENLPLVVTQFRAGDLNVRRETFAIACDGERVVEQITIENKMRAPRRATLYLALRPFNPEGVALVREIEYHAPGIFLVNRALGVVLPQPDEIACSDFAAGDVALALPKLNGTTRAHCAAGLATAIAAYHVELAPGASQTFTAQMPLTRQDLDDEEIAHPQSLVPNLPPDARAQTITTWRENLGRGMAIRVPDEKLQAAFDANKAYLLLLHDGDTITPGPWTYHQFWFRDAAFLLNALAKVGYLAETQAVLERFARRIAKDGYARATEGEWDSNGAALWTFVEHARLAGDTGLLAGNYWNILRMASWINSKRQKTKVKSKKPARVPHFGLLSPGPSAEHLGPSDYFYWDDFWGLAGLRAAAFAAAWLQQPNDAAKLRANFEAFRVDVDASLTQVAAQLGRAAMPASPYRRLDAGMIGSLAASYPLRLFAANDPRIVDTLSALKEVAWIEDAYFNHVGHSAFGTYLSLHVAQCLLFQRDPAAWKTIDWVLRHASPTFTWAEGIHPRTRCGGMGDGHHGWAVADFLLTVRHALLFEEDDHLVLTPALPLDWTTEMNVIKVERAPTYFGDVSFTLAFGERNATLVIHNAWRDATLKYVEWNLPFALSQAGVTNGTAEIVGNTVRLSPDCSRVVVMW